MICLADPDETERPTGFSAEAGSKRMLMVMVLKRASAKGAAVSPPVRPQPQQPGQAGKILSDDEVTRMLAGEWKLNDSAGSLYIAFHSNGTFSTVREYEQLRLFHKSFVQTPISSGNWSVKDGTLTIHITMSVRFERVNQRFSFAVRSISGLDMIFVDHNLVASAVPSRFASIRSVS